jgi:endonuclease/exonuclease/phosphatase family metal-dependent hydrolase
MMMAHAQEYNRDVNFAIVMCGDFNSTPDGLTYQLITSHTAPSFDGIVLPTRSIPPFIRFRVVG